MPWDLAFLSDVASTLGGERASPETLADLMVRDQAVVGVVRGRCGSKWVRIWHRSALLLLRGQLAAAAGRSEFGPRALGHRSLLAVAAQPTIREKLNSIKKRK